ncbi:MAG: RNHCP domain-containing protein [Chloroflexota bacterium]|nr:RNHCP domain-containing protein [Chloroflexota bacterium]
MSRTYRRDERPKWARQTRRDARQGNPFRCCHCKRFIGSLPSGGQHRNHCPVCLHSRHVDGRIPGDRRATCGGKMAPSALFARPNGEQVLVHRCLACGFERHNRVAADDDPLVTLRLPLVTPRHGLRPDSTLPGALPTDIVEEEGERMTS